MLKKDVCSHDWKVDLIIKLFLGAFSSLQTCFFFLFIYSTGCVAPWHATGCACTTLTNCFCVIPRKERVLFYDKVNKFYTPSPSRINKQTNKRVQNSARRSLTAYRSIVCWGFNLIQFCPFAAGRALRHTHTHACTHDKNTHWASSDGPVQNGQLLHNPSVFAWCVRWLAPMPGLFWPQSNSAEELWAASHATRKAFF